jgi:hypothetical protein
MMGGLTQRLPALHPAQLGEHKAIQLFAKVFHHVVALGLAMHQYIQAQRFLAADGQRDVLLHGLLIVGSRQFAAFEGGAGAADAGSLRKGADGGGGQQGQLQPVLLLLCPAGEGAAALVGTGRQLASLSCTAGR